MDGGFLSSRRGVSSMVALLIAASATIMYLTSHKAGPRAWGLLGVGTGGTDTDAIGEDSDDSEKPRKKSRKRGAGAPKMRREAIEKMLSELKQRRIEILKQFEESQHRTIPREMRETMEHINSLDPSTQPPEIRLMCSQLIQDYAIMHTNIHESEPDFEVIDFAKEWLDFDPDSVAMRVEQINHRYALSLRSRLMKEFEELFDWLHRLSLEEVSRESIHENWVLRNFQCSCLLGRWKSVLKYGRMLEGINPELLAAQSGQSGSATPLHPLHLFEYIALKLPNQSANFTQAYYNCEQYAEQFDSSLLPPLKFTEWVKDCSTQLVEAMCTDVARHEDLQQSVTRAASPTKVASCACMFVYGCLVQFPCYWVQLPSVGDKMQPVVLCGPWSESEMEMTSSYVRRVKSGEAAESAPGPADLAAPARDSQADEKKEDSSDEKKIMAVRSDLRLNLCRYAPSMTGDLVTDREAAEDPSRSAKAASSGWLWKGTFDHEEGVIEVPESQLTDFEFRRDHSWKERAKKFTIRTWEVQMIVLTPD